MRMCFFLSHFCSKPLRVCETCFAQLSTSGVDPASPCNSAMTGSVEDSSGEEDSDEDNDLPAADQGGIQQNGNEEDDEDNDEVRAWARWGKFRSFSDINHSLSPERGSERASKLMSAVERGSEVSSAEPANK